MTLTEQSVTIRTARHRAGPDVAALSRRFEEAHPRQIIEWAVGEFGRRLVLTASFADALLIDLAVAVDPDIEVVFIDTGFHFAETLATVRCTRNRPPTAPTSFSAISPPFGPLTSEGTQTIVSATPERSALWDGSNRPSSRAETR